MGSGKATVSLSLHPSGLPWSPHMLPTTLHPDTTRLKTCGEADTAPLSCSPKVHPLIATWFGIHDSGLGSIDEGWG